MTVLVWLPTTQAILGSVEGQGFEHWLWLRLLRQQQGDTRTTSQTTLGQTATCCCRTTSRPETRMTTTQSWQMSFRCQITLRTLSSMGTKRLMASLIATRCRTTKAVTRTRERHMYMTTCSHYMLGAPQLSATLLDCVCRTKSVQKRAVHYAQLCFTILLH